MALSNPVMGPSLNQISIEEIKRELGQPPSSCAVVQADHVVGVFIWQESGQVNDNHCHDYDEWWVVLEGEIDWVIEGRDEPVHAKAGDFVYVISWVHAAHVIGGVAILVVALIHAFGLKYKVTEKRKLRFQLSLTYWHFVDLLWVYLFFFLTLYR